MADAHVTRAVLLVTARDAGPRKTHCKYSIMQPRQ